jgi:Fe-S cluster assembly scaffold protein SufB
VETGSAITWKYPSVVLKGDNSVGEFFSVALTNHHQQADTGELVGSNIDPMGQGVSIRANVVKF